MSHTRRDVNPVVALLGIVATLTVVQVLFWRQLAGSPPEELSARRGGPPGGSRVEAHGGRSTVWVATMAGSPEPGHRDGPAGAARFDGPAALACDSAGAVYVADSRNHCVRRITPGGLVSTLAGAAGEAGFADGAPTEARFSGPAGILLAGDGSLLVADTGNHRLRRVFESGEVSTIAGAETACDDVGRPLGGHRDGPAHEAQFRFPVGLAVSSDGTIYIGDAGNHCVRRIGVSGEVSTVLTEGDVEMEAPTHLALGGDGRLWVADSASSTLWVGPSSGPLRPWSGPEEAAGFVSPAGIAFVRDAGGRARLMIADSGANCVWEVSEGRVAMLAGAGGGGPADWRDGSGDQARFAIPAGLAAGPGAAVLVADFGNNSVRQLTSRAAAEEVE